MISWIKLDINILDDAKIKIIRSHPDGNAIVVLWIGLLCLAMKSQHPGLIEISDALPYTIDDLSNLFGIDKKTCELGLVLFKKYKMVDLIEGGGIEIINFSRHQSLEDIEHKRELARIRTAKYRDRLRISHAPVTHNSVTVTLTDKIRQDKIRQDKESVAKKRRVFTKPSLADVKAYCMERKNNVDAEAWIDHYASNGWKVGNNPMIDWKAAVRTWERNGGKYGRRSDSPGGSGIPREHIEEHMEITDDQRTKNAERARRLAAAVYDHLPNKV